MNRSKDQKYIKCFSILLAFLLIFALIYLLIKQIEEFNLQTDPMLDRLRSKLTEFFDHKKNWNGNLATLNGKNPMKNINLYKSNKSYTINKERIYMCLKDETGNYYSENMLIYVLLHELGHVLSKSIGHTDEFYRIFDDLLLEATKNNLYDPNQPIVKDYCQHGDDDDNE